jgi:hypothetical protein
MEVAYGKTPIGQLLYDLCFVKLTDTWVARKHRIGVAEVRSLRQKPDIKRLSQQVKRDKRK